MHKFYVSNARFSFKNSSNKDSNVECTGNTKIQDGLMSIGVASVSVSDIATSSLQCSDESSPKEIMVMVSGSIILKGQDAPKLFAQSFFISEAMEGVMFIVAESLHILSSVAQGEEKDESSNTKLSAELLSEPEKVEVIKETKVERSEPVAQPVATAPVQPTPQETPAVTESTPTQTQPTEKPKSKQQAQQTQAPKEKIPAQAWGPNSKNAKVMSSITPLFQQPTKSEEKSATTQAEGSSIAAEPSTAKQQQQQSAASSSSGNHGQRLSKEQVERSVYIKDLPSETTKDEIQEVFSKFGKISLVDLRQEKRCVYVEYVDPASAKAALIKPATPIMLAGKPIEVKERLMVQQSEGSNNNSNGNSNSNSRGAKSAAKPKPSGGANSSNGNRKAAPKQPAKSKENGTAKSEESKPAPANDSEDKQKGAASASKGNSASENKPKQQPKQNQNQPKPAGKPKST